MTTPESAQHDYEPGEGRHPMETDPLCRVCNGSKRDRRHQVYTVKWYDYHGELVASEEGFPTYGDAEHRGIEKVGTGGTVSFEVEGEDD